MNNLYRFILFLICGFLFLLGINFIIPDKFRISYQREIVNQYDYFRNLKQNKIVFVGFSSQALCFDLDLMERLTHRQCAALGNASDQSYFYLLEMTKSNLKSGDTVVIFLQEIKGINPRLYYLFSGIGRRFDLYRYFSAFDYRLKKELLKNYMIYLKANIKNNINNYMESGGIYTIYSYNDRGNFIADKPKSDDFDFPITTKEYLTPDIDNSLLDYFNKYVAYCKKKNVKVYFAATPILKDSITDNNRINEDRISQKYDKYMKNNLPAPYISDLKNYIFPKEYMYNGIYYCTNEGTEKRTYQLYRDLKPYLNKEN